ncbi:MAG TPA: hypothetical protein VNZ58_00075, partial [Thermomicrobiales bacterium]|nr:hypothetical protein [Thermomicrobiales bacterium]
LGVFGFVNLWIAVLADVGTSIVVTLNGLRLARMQVLSTPVAEALEDVCGCGEDHDHAHEHVYDAASAD